MNFAIDQSRLCRFAGLFSALFLSASLSGCATLQEAAPVSPPGSTLNRLAEKYGACAAAVAFVKAGKLDRVETASGCQKNAPLAPDAIFQAASLSKPVFARAVLKMAEQGKISLDAPLSNYLPQGYSHRPYPFLPDFANKTTAVDDPRLGAVTARMVLNHTSGLPNWTGGPLKFDFAPGQGWQYSGEGYVLLQRAVEAITHSRLDVAMEVTTFRPLAMSSSSYVWRDAFDVHFQRGNNGQDKTWTQKFAEPVAAATLYTSAADYAHFLGSVISDKNLMKTTLSSPVSVDAGLHLSWGLGWGVEQTTSGTYIFQWGNNPGYRAFAIASLATGDGLVVLTNSDDGMALAEPLTKDILPGEHPVFKFHLLQEGVAGAFCGWVGFCP